MINLPDNFNPVTEILQNPAAWPEYSGMTESELIDIISNQPAPRIANYTVLGTINLSKVFGKVITWSLIALMVLSYIMVITSNSPSSSLALCAGCN